MGWFSKKKVEVKSNLSDNYSLFLTGSGNVFLFTNYPLMEIINNYTQVAPLNTAVSLMSDAVGQLPICLRKRDKKEIIASHPILDLLRFPNNTIQQTQSDLFRDMALWRLLEGDAYIIATGAVNKAPAELICVNPQQVTVTPDGKGWIRSIEYGDNMTQQSYKFIPGTNRFFNDSKNGEMFHIRGFNPQYSPTNLTGMSEIVSVYYEANQYLAAGSHNLGLLKNGARPSGALVLTSKDGNPIFMNEESFARLKSEIESSYSGSFNAGKPLLLEGGLDWKEMSINPKEGDWINMQKYAEQQIYKKLGFPIALVSTEASTYNNMQEARLEFYENRVLPFAEKILDHFNKFLLPRFGVDFAKNHELTVDVDQINVFNLRKTLRRDTIEKSTTMTLNEKRRMLGDPDVEGGNRVFYQQIPIAGEGVMEAERARIRALEAGKVPPTRDGNNDIAPQKPKSGGIVETVPFLFTKNLFTPELIEDPEIYLTISSITDQMYLDLVLTYGKDVIEEISDQLNFNQTEYVNRFIRSSSADLITNVNNTTKQLVRKELMEGFSNQEPIEKIIERITAVFDDPARAEKIAVTETTRAAGFASREALDQAGVEGGIWLAVKDSHTRDAHRAMDGQKSDHGGYFTAPSGARARHPGGFGIPSLDINCRCAVVADFGQEDGKQLTEEYLTKEWYRKEEKRASKEDVVKTAMRKVFTLQKDAVILGLQ